MAGKGKEVVYVVESEDETSSETESVSEGYVERDNGNGTVLCVDFIPNTSTKDQIKTLFEQYGKAQVEMHITEEGPVCYVTYASPHEARNAISGLHGQHIMPEGRQPITVVLQKERAAEWPLNECFEKLNNFTMDNSNPDLDVGVVEGQEKFCKSMTMTIGRGGADSLISLMKEVAADRRHGEHQGSSPNAIEKGVLSVERITHLIMEPLDGKPIPKKRKKALHFTAKETEEGTS